MLIKTTNDIGLRSYIYNTGGFKVSDGARFVIDADGTRHITNLAVHAFNDDFDFNGDGLVGTLDPIAEAQIDPPKIGRAIKIDFINKESVPVDLNYTLSDFNLEVSKNDLAFNPVQGGIATVIEGEFTVSDLYSKDVISFLGRESLFLRKLVLGIPAQASGKNLTRPLMPAAAPAVLLLSFYTRQGV